MLGRRPDGAALGGHGPARPAHACTCIRRLLPHRDHGDDPCEAHCPAKVTSARALAFPVPNRFQPAFSLNHPVNKYGRVWRSPCPGPWRLESDVSLHVRRARTHRRPARTPGDITSAPPATPLGARPASVTHRCSDARSATRRNSPTFTSRRAAGPPEPASSRRSRANGCLPGELRTAPSRQPQEFRKRLPCLFNSSSRSRACIWAYASGCTNTSVPHFQDHASDNWEPEGASSDGVVNRSWSGRRSNMLSWSTCSIW